MNYETRPWGPAFNPTCHCPKCGAPMHNDQDRQSGIEVRACFKCGNRVYPEYPKHPGTKNTAYQDIENPAG